jgi:hypothetical protein
MRSRGNWHARYHLLHVCKSALVESKRANLLQFVSIKLAAGLAVTYNNCNTNRQDISWLSCIGPAVAIHGFFDWFQFITAFVYHSASSNPDHAFDLALFFITLAPFGFAYLAYKVRLVYALPVFAGRSPALFFLNPPLLTQPPPPPHPQVVWVQWELLNRDLGLSEDWEDAAISWK